MSELFMDP